MYPMKFRKSLTTFSLPELSLISTDNPEWVDIFSFNFAYCVLILRTEDWYFFVHWFEKTKNSMLKKKVWQINILNTKQFGH